jgi:hypothetical protein
VTIQERTQATSCCNLLAPVRQLSSNRRSATSVHRRTLPGISFLLNLHSNTFLDSPAPNKSTISRLVNRFRDTGSVQDRNRSGRPSALRDDSLDDIRHTLLRSPRKSLRKLSLQRGLSYGITHKATKILKLHPYRVHVNSRNLIG